MSSESTISFSSIITQESKSLSSSLQSKSISFKEESSVSTLGSSSESGQKSSISFILLGIIFGSVNASAATNDGWRLPYQAGQRPTLNSRAFDPEVYTHTNFAAFDFASTNGIIVAAKSGKVIFSGYQENNFGNVLVIQSQDGSIGLYAHLNSKNVNLDDNVSRGQQIAAEGWTGNVLPKGPGGKHLHFETIGYLPCALSDSINKCWWGTDYKNAQMLPQFDECYKDRGGKDNTYPDCTSGYPNKKGYWYESINSLAKFTESIKPESNRNFAFDVSYANTANQTKVQLWNYNNQVQQKWGFDSKNNTIVGLSDKCIDAGNVFDANNRWLRIHDCHGGTNQKWFVDQRSRIHSMADENLCVDSASGNAAGSMLYMYPCHTGANQVWAEFNMNSKNWNPSPAQCTNCTPMTYIKAANNSAYVFDIWGGNTSAEQQPIKMGNPNGRNNQKFQYNPNTKEIKNLDGKCVDGGAIWNGWSLTNTALRTNTCTGISNQKWYTEGPGRIRSQYDNNLCVDSANSNTTGSIIYLSPCHNGSNQRWNWW